jgi:hypothetical protein
MGRAVVRIRSNDRRLRRRQRQQYLLTPIAFRQGLIQGLIGD